ncbi:MAG: hemerythrin domain-containing protein, partial [Mariprofundaceae bacterium]|nr:hemerythrin domain-containing protein [Mariprofundaceae bacterium]
MAVIWRDEYSTGEPEIDKQHKVIFQYLDDLEKHMQAGDISDLYVKNLMDQLGIFTRSHFCYEEICMRRYKCPVGAKNKEIHTKLLKTYTEYRHQLDAEGVTEDLIQKIHDFLESWL